MTLYNYVSDAMSFRLATSFGEDGSEVVCIILMMPEEDVKVDPNLLQLMTTTSPLFFKPAFYMFAAGVSWCFATSSTKSNCACKSLLASHSSDGLGLK
jgi:hypothetical protein